ncbi:unnamed protein product [Rotaria sordida]|uniref:F-box domain-containing protein n=1 Tax=Rotaria sordida TaxID=392033 RepID=A0A814G566_9BILA|nr:unnamed protein product [Rotaria sordida]
MDTSNNNRLNILDLPNEILLNIISKLSFIDVFYSLVDINERFYQLSVDPLYIRHLDMAVMTMKSLFEYTSSVDDQVLSKICENILPFIHSQVYKLTLEQHSIERILLNGSYPKLYSISLVNFQKEKLFHYLTDNSILRHLLSQQITYLNIDIEKKHIDMKNEDLGGIYSYTSRLCEISRIFILILSLCKRLISLNFCQLFFKRNASICIHQIPQTRCMSESLTKLKVNVKDFDDCLYLLDSNLKCLSKLIINVEYIGPKGNFTLATKKLPKLKYFSLCSIYKTFNNDERIISLLHRMINLEELILFLSVVRFNSNVIDGIQLHDEILIHMPRLNKFTFSINTKLLIENDIKTDITTKEDIQHSFIGKEFGLVQVGSYVYYKRLCSIIEYHIYTLPYQFENFLHLNNSFQGGMFHNVRCLTMKNDTHHFEHQLLKVISQDFPFLKELIIKNVLPQQKQHSSSLITFRHLILLNLAEAHVDYAEEFLVDKNIHLPCLLNLRIKFESLEMVTKNFTNDATRLTCAKLKKLHIDDEFVQSKNFQKYFPLL